MDKLLRKRLFILCLLVFAGMFLAPGNAEAAKTKVIPNQLKLSVGNKKTLKVKNASKNVVWASNKASVAKVSSKGVITARKKGTAVITAKISGKKYKCRVKVTDAKLNATRLTISRNEVRQLKFKTYKGKGVVWKSENPKVATVTKNGKVKGIKPGTATISAKLQSSTYQCKVTVTSVNKTENSVPARDWGSIIDLPSKKEIKKFNKKATSRSPYISGYPIIGSEMKYTEYSIDFKADYLPYGTYISCANIKMDLSALEQKYDEVKMDSWLSFYAGLQMWEPGKGSGSIMSFWDIYCTDKAGKTKTIRAKLVYPKKEKANAFDHEGSGVNYLKEYKWEKGCWYRMLFRCIPSKENGHTLVEQKICNLKTGKWTKLCCYDTGLTDSCFVGSAGIFLENYLIEYAGDIRTAEFKNIRIRLKDTEQWTAIKQVSMNRAFDYPGSFCFGADDEQFWMITTGLKNRSIQKCEKDQIFSVNSCLSDSPY